jgi:cytochrome c oxidase subunit I+III
MPGKPWGVRSIPRSTAAIPLWDQPNFERDVDEGRFYLPDAEEGSARRSSRRSSTPADTVPAAARADVHPADRGGATTGGFFIFGTFTSGWGPALISLVLALGVIMYWLWTGTASFPRRREGRRARVDAAAVRLGSDSVGWWAMFITMLAMLTAFVSLVFGYFFFWTLLAFHRVNRDDYGGCNRRLSAGGVRDI